MIERKAGYSTIEGIIRQTKDKPLYHLYKWDKKGNNGKTKS